MRRRTVLALVAAALSRAATGAAVAQGELQLVIIVGLNGNARRDEVLRQTLAQAGHVESRTIRLVSLNAGNDVERVPDLARAAVARDPAVIVASGLPVVRALRAVTSAVPIVALTGFWIESGFAASLSRPGSNLTGVNIVATELDAKRLSLLSEFIPGGRRVAILRDTNVANAAHIAEMEAAARELGLVLEILDVRRPAEIDGALRAARARGADAVNVLASPLLNGAVREVAASARAAGLPTMCQWREMAEAGCVLSYGSPLDEAWRLTAKQIDRVLRGARPAELPIEQPTAFELVVNKAAAAAVGLAVPPSLLARADEVIE
jgi:putative tryptophan/tyrosine transport system substrate-binding protein